MIYMRGQARDYDALGRADRRRRLALGQRAARTSSAREHYRWMRRRRRVRTARRRRVAGREAAAALGHPRRLRARPRSRPAFRATDDFNRGDNEGVGYFEVNQRERLALEHGQGLPAAGRCGRPNFEMWTSAQVTRLVIERSPRRAALHRRARSWDGHELVDGARHARGGAVRRQPSARRSSCSSRASARRDAAAASTASRWWHDLPGVGANLQDHLQIRAVYKVSGARTLNALAGDAAAARRGSALEYALQAQRADEHGALAARRLHAQSTRAANRANLEYHVQPLSARRLRRAAARLPGVHRQRLQPQPDQPRHACASAAPGSRTRRAIAPNYLEHRGGPQGGGRFAARHAAHRGAAGAGQLRSPRNGSPALQYQSDEELARLAGDIATTIFHPVGTTRMGRDGDPMAVLDRRLRVRGIAGLRVVDAGAMPTITSGNTNSPTLMMAEKAAEWVREAAL